MYDNINVVINVSVALNCLCS